jgi:hypothetical protein
MLIKKHQNLISIQLKKNFDKLKQININIGFESIFQN